MDFVVLLSVLTIAHIQVSARPVDSEEFTTKSGDEIRFKFPTDISNGLVVTINGTWDPSKGNFMMKLPVTSRNEKEACQIVTDFKNEIVKVSPAINDATVSYNFVGPKNGSLPFSIEISAEWNNKHLFRLLFNHNNSGPVDLTCEAKKFSEYGYIIFGGSVQIVSTMLFEFK